MVGLAKKAKPAPSDQTRELHPVRKDAGPVLRLEDDGTLQIAFGVRQANWPIGPDADEATKFVTYQTVIPEGQARGFSNLTREGVLLTGWLLMDGSGQVLGRLANDDEVVYEVEAVEKFGKLAGLSVEDWGRVEPERIEKLMKTPRAPKPGEKRTLGASGREWLMAAAVLGGIMIAWPVASQITFSTERGHSLAIMFTGVSGFLVAGLGLGLGRLAKGLADKLVLVVSLLIAAGFVAGWVYTAANQVTIWRLAVGQLPTMLLGAAIIFVVLPFWARRQRAQVKPRSS